MAPDYTVNITYGYFSKYPRYGRSIGSGPSLYLASHPKCPVSGVILHSPLASGLRLFDINVRE